MASKRIILDCDGGSDDAWALLLLVRAEEEQRARGVDFKILGVTICGCGNTTLEAAAKNMLRILRAMDRLDIPIFLGATDPVLPIQERFEERMFHGKDGFGDCLTTDPELERLQTEITDEHAVVAIKRLCYQFPNQISIIAVGPLTNLALCYSMYGQKLIQKIGEIFIMGGNHLGVGNFTRSAEFNFYCDPEAAFTVLSKSVCPITILPWEPCLEEKFCISLEWRLEALGDDKLEQNGPAQLLNIVERTQYSSVNSNIWNPCDALLVGIFLFGQNIIRKESFYHATVDLKGCHTRGQMVLDHLHEVDKNPKNVRIIELVDAEFFKQISLWAARLCHFDPYVFQVCGETQQKE